MKKILAFAAILAAALSTNSAFAESEIVIKYNGEELCFSEKPIIVNDKTLVQLRPIAVAMGLDIDFSGENGSVILSDKETTLIFTQDSEKIVINEQEETMDVPMVIHNDYTFVPVRNLVEPFGEKIDYDGETKTVTIESEKKEASREKSEELTEKETEENLREEDETAEENGTDEPKVISTGSGEYDFVHFYQSQPELELEGSGRGYCWVCSYAMLFSNATKSVITPLDIAQYNIDKGYSGNFMAGHETLAAEFGLKLVPALSDNSPYYAGFNTKNKGETAVLVTSDEEAREAICEALDNFPSGVIVRYEGYPHSMVAVCYDEENIYFNDPGMKNGEHVPFEETCLKNFKLSDISYIQAVEVEDERL
ncbi:MAG: copper amine oxidase N-terminal domain-containing protein [Clostridia bacterium]|nr:copper amine oxidase N-terminal domain-containing protein [Clostridia bacterium]